MFTLSTTTLALNEDFGNIQVTINSSNDGDVDGITQTLSYSINTTNTGFATLTINPLSGTINISSLLDALGNATITVTANDGGMVNNLSTQVFSLTIIDINTPPRFDLSITQLNLEENFTTNTDVFVINPNDGDITVTQTLSYSITPSTTHFATLSIDQIAGSVTINSIGNNFGRVTVSVVADDSSDTNNRSTQTFILSVGSVNDPPTFTLSTSTLVLNEDFGNAQVTVSSSDDGDALITQTLSYSINTTNVGFATLTISTISGAVTINSVANAFGQATITVTVDDSSATDNIATQTFALIVNSVNELPSFTLSTSAITVNEDFSTIPVTVTNSSDGDDFITQTLSYSVSISESIANLSIHAQSGALTITNIANAFGQATITVTVDDSSDTANIATQTITLNVNPVNDAPEFTLSTTTLLLNEDFGNAQLTITNSNDGDVDGVTQTITYSINTTNVGFATLAINTQSGAVTINSVANAFGQATIHVIADDGGAVDNLATQTFSLTVNSVNELPSFTLSTSAITVNEDFGTIPVTVTNSSDGDDFITQTLTYSISTTNLSFATLAINTQSGAVTINNIANAFGQATITVTVDDSSATDNIATQTFSLTVNSVNELPSFTLSTSAVTVNEDFGTILVTVTNSSDGDDFITQTLTYSVSISESIANLAIDAQSGTLTITNIANAFGQATITVTVDDSSATDNIATQTFTLTVNSVNELPSFTLSTSAVTVNEDFGTILVTVTNSSDGDDFITQTLNYSISTTNLSFATLAINAQSGAVTINSVANAFGQATITVTVDDSSATNNIATQTFTLTVNPVNDAPEFTLSTTTLALNEDFGNIQVTINSSNDGDVDGITQTLSYSINTTNTGFATLTINPLSGTINISSLLDALGNATITVTANDSGVVNNLSTQVFSLTIIDINTPPRFDLSITQLNLEENFTTNTDVFVINPNDGDITVTQTLSYSITPSTTHFATLSIDQIAGSVTINSIGNNFGRVTVSVVADDSSDTNNRSTQTFILSVGSVNDPPTFTLSTSTLVLNEDFGNAQVTVSSSDDGDALITQTLSYSINTTNVGFATLTISTISGAVTINSVANAFGQATITVTVDDSSATDNIATQTFALIVNSVNELPSFTLSTSAVTVNEDFGTIPVTVTNSSDGDDFITQTLSYSVSISESIANLSIHAQSGALTITNIANAFGQATITVTVDDSSDTANIATQTITLNVNPVNDAPEFTLSTTTLLLNEDFGNAQLTITNSNDGDVDGVTQTITYSINTTNVGFATLAINTQSGAVTINSVANAFGQATIHVIADDGGAVDNLATQTFSLTVNSVNELPSFTLSTSAITVNEDFGTIPVTVTNSSDGDDFITQTLTYSISTTNLSFATLAINTQSGAVTINNIANAFGQATITVTVDDSSATDNIATQTFSLTVNSVNELPSFTLSTSAVTVNEDFGTILVTVTNSSDGDDFITQTLTYSVSISESIANLAIDAQSGTLTITNIANAFGQAIITVTVDDSSDTANIATQTITLNVNPVNDAPEFTLSTTTLALNEDFGNIQVTINSSNDGDVDGITQTLSYSINTTNTGFATLTINPLSGTINISSLLDALGNATITVTANDSGVVNNLSTQVFSLTIIDINTPPRFDLSITQLNLEENFTTNTDVFVINPNDGDITVTQTLSYSITPSTTHFATLSIDQIAGSVTINSIGNNFGRVTVSVVADDSSDTNNRSTQTFILSVGSVNDPPTFTLSTSTLVLNEDFGNAQVTVSSSDDGDALITQTLSYSINTTNVGFATLTISTISGAVTINSVANAFGQATITVTVDDSSATDNIATQTFALIVNSVNELPSFTLSTSAITVNEDFSTIPVTVTNSSDGDDFITQTLSYSVSISESIANLSIHAQSGALTITNIANAFGQATITVTVDDSSDTANIATQTITLNVNPVNDAPEFTLSTTTLLLNEDFGNAQLTITNSNDGDVDGVTQTITYSINTTNVGFATLAINTQSGAVTINSVANAFGQATIHVIADDGGAVDNLATQTFSLTVNSVNELPSFTLSTSAITVNEDFGTIPVTVTNSSDGDDFITQTLTYSISTTNLSFATLAINTQSGAVTINNIANAFGQATITVTVDDSSDTDNIATQTFTLTVNSVNELPSFTLSTSAVTVNEDFGTILVTVTNSSDGDDFITQTLTYSVSISESIANLAIDAQSGTLTITNIANAFGQAIITVTVDDSSDTANIATQTITLNVNPVNDAPEFTLSTTTLALNEDFGNIQVTINSSNDGDVDGITQTLSYSINTTNTGFATLTINPLSGTINISSLLDALGNATITVTANDGGMVNNLSTQVFSLTIIDINTPPRFDLSITQLNLEENFTTNTDVFVINPNDGDITVTQTLSYSITPSTTHFATLSIDQIAGSVTINSIGNNFGRVTVSVVADDSSDTNNRSTQTFILSVGSVNDPPTFTLSTNTLVLNEDFGNAQVTVSSSDDGDALITQTLSYSINTTNVGFATLTISTISGAVTINSVANAFGQATITVTVDDSSATDNIATQTFALIVNSVNELPSFTLSTSAITVNEDFGTIPVTVTNSSDGDDFITQTLSYSISTTNLGFATLVINTQSGAVTINSVANAFGQAIVTVTVDDSSDTANIAIQTITLNVNPVNDAPEFILSTTTLLLNEDFGNAQLTITNSNDGDVDGITQTIAYSISTTNVGFATLAINTQSGAVTINSVANAFGQATIHVIADDDGVVDNLATQTFTLTVNPVNELPSFTLSTSAITVNENFGTIQATVTNSSDGDDFITQTLNYSVSISEPIANLAIHAQSGTLTVTNVDNAFGQAIITVTVDDSSDTDNLATQTIALTINPINQSPSFTLSATMLNLDEDFGTLIIPVISSNDGDPFIDQALIYSIDTTSTEFANITINTNSGEITITSIENAFGQATITVTIDDSSDTNNIATQTLTLNVASVNDSPNFVLSTSAITVYENFDSTQVTIISSDDGDPESTQAFIYQISTTNVGFATLSIDAQSGTMTINSMPDAFGVATIFVIAEETVATDVRSIKPFVLTVEPVNSPPVFVISTNLLTLNENFRSRQVTVLSSDDGDAFITQPLRYSVFPSTSNLASFTINERSGTLIISSLPDAFGRTEVTIIADDSSATNNLATQTIVLNIQSVNDNPNFMLSTTSVILDEDFNSTQITVISSDDGDPFITQVLSYSISTTNVSFATLSISTQSGTITISNIADAFGITTVTVTVNDSSDTDNLAVQMFVLIVHPVNDPPVFNLSTNALTLDEDFGDEQISILNPQDGDNSTQTITYNISTTDVGFATLAINPLSGIVNLYSVDNAFGTATVHVIADDGSHINSRSTESFTLNVRSVNDPPVFALSVLAISFDNRFTQAQVTIFNSDDGDDEVEQTLSYSVSTTDIGFARLFINSDTGLLNIFRTSNDIAPPTEIAVFAQDELGARSTQTITLSATADTTESALYPALVSVLAGNGNANYIDGHVGESQFKFPTDASVAPDGRIFIADRDNHAIRVISADGTRVSTYAGSGQIGYADGPALQARFNAPSGIAVANDNRIFVADTNNHRIRVISADGSWVSTYAATGGIGAGAGGFSDGDALTMAYFNAPTGIAIANDGRIFIADTNNHRIRVISADGSWVSTYAGSGSVGDRNGSTTTAQFNAPQGVAIMQGELLLVADTNNHRIRMINAEGSLVSTYAGSSIGNSDGSTTTAQFNAPQSLTAIGRMLFVSDSGNNLIRAIDGNGSVYTFTDSILRTPAGITTTSDNRTIVITSQEEHRVISIDINNEAPTLSLSTMNLSLQVGFDPVVIYSTATDSNNSPLPLHVMTENTSTVFSTGATSITLSNIEEAGITTLTVSVEDSLGLVTTQYIVVSVTDPGIESIRVINITASAGPNKGGCSLYESSHEKAKADVILWFLLLLSAVSLWFRRNRLFSK